MVQKINPRRASTDPVFAFRVDPDAEPGNVLRPLARLLIQIDRRLRQAQAEPPPTEATKEET